MTNESSMTMLLSAEGDDRMLGSSAAQAVNLLAFPRERRDSFLWLRGKGSGNAEATLCGEIDS